MATVIFAGAAGLPCHLGRDKKTGPGRVDRARTMEEA